MQKIEENNMTVGIGETYKFNNATAIVLLLTKDHVTWHDAKGSYKHVVPRWYFEKYARHD